MKPIKCDLCKLPAVYKEGKFNYCARHAPIWTEEGEQPPTEERPYTPGQSGLFKKRDGTEFERRKR